MAAYARIREEIGKVIIGQEEVIEQVLIAARVADAAAERTALLETALAGLDRDAATLPAEWLAATRAATKK